MGGGAAVHEGAPDSDGSPPPSPPGDDKQAECDDPSWPWARAAGLILTFVAAPGRRGCYQSYRLPGVARSPATTPLVTECARSARHLTRIALRVLTAGLSKGHPIFSVL